MTKKKENDSETQTEKPVVEQSDSRMDTQSSASPADYPPDYPCVELEAITRRTVAGVEIHGPERIYVQFKTLEADLPRLEYLRRHKRWSVVAMHNFNKLDTSSPKRAADAKRAAQEIEFLISPPEMRRGAARE